MDTCDDRRERLRDELRRAYENWMDDCTTAASRSAAVDVSGCPDAAKSSWFRYLDAQERLIAAFGDA
ncbi:MAG TPA: hypothetical protein VFB13_13870 [Reyranella sp.]|nr:hypothetical protein [Reyranella sp.]